MMSSDAVQQQPEGSDGTNARQEEEDHDEDLPDSSDDWKLQRDAEKQLGDASFRSGDYRTALAHYTAALSVDPDFAVALSNRSACYMKVGEKSRALHDAQACVGLGTFRKGYSRLAAALQSLGRYEAALENWNVVLRDEPSSAAALQGRLDCQEQIRKQREAKAAEVMKEETANTTASNNKKESGAGDDDADADHDDLDDFFNDVEEAASEVVKEKQQLAAASEQQQATNAIKHQKKDLGTAGDQIDRILAPNHQWRNLNPFFVLDVPHTASKDEISRRFKALSLLLHPDKNPNHDRAQDAYDQVLKAKAALDDELKYSHARQLVEQGVKQGRADFDRRQRFPATADNKINNNSNSHGKVPQPLSLEECQARAVQKIFAEVEHTRRQVEQRERSHEQREREKEEAEAEKARSERKFDKNWKQEERVEKRIGNWRDFSKHKKPKP